MTLIYILIIIAAERLCDKPHYLQTDYYYSRYKALLNKRQWLNSELSGWRVLVLCLMPAFAVWGALYVIDSGLINFIATLFILFVSIGNSDLRDAFKCYLHAANSGDVAACRQYSQTLGQDESDTFTFGQHLIWLNYQRYCAPIIMFVAGGVFAVIAYSTIRVLNGYSQKYQLNFQSHTQRFLAVIDWIPVRLTALGFLLVGHFSRALPVWLSTLLDIDKHPKAILSNVATAAEDVNHAPDDWVIEPTTLVSLAKRNVLFIVSIIAILTLLGVIT